MHAHAHARLKRAQNLTHMRSSGHAHQREEKHRSPEDATLHNESSTYAPRVTSFITASNSEQNESVRLRGSKSSPIRVALLAFFHKLGQQEMLCHNTSRTRS
eukprot:4066142-Pleurochrysis_carterae.AAC.1